jgi:hypothetical protein
LGDSHIHPKRVEKVAARQEITAQVTLSPAFVRHNPPNSLLGSDRFAPADFHLAERTGDFCFAIVGFVVLAIHWDLQFNWMHNKHNHTRR